MDAFRFADPNGGPDGGTFFVTLSTVDSHTGDGPATDEELNKGKGACELQWQDLREIVADVLLADDGLSYKVGDFVVMPNHLHVLVGIYPGHSVDDQCAEWMASATREVNEARGRTGTFWQHPPRTERVADWDDFDFRKKYIRRDPKQANLRVGAFYLHIADED